MTLLAASGKTPVNPRPQNIPFTEFWMWHEPFVLALPKGAFATVTTWGPGGRGSVGATRVMTGLGNLPRERAARPLPGTTRSGGAAQNVAPLFVRAPSW